MATLLQSESRRLYSWWWDSHISPKNSKWLQENLTDMDIKVKAMIKLIEEDADSFARRAEMYYKKRPELMKMVEEFYRAYRALAERYDQATGALRQAHRTMAEAFPNQIPPVLNDESLSSSSGFDMEPHTPEMPAPIRALYDPDDSQKDSSSVPSHFHVIKRSGAYSEENDVLSRRGLKQLNDMFATGEGEASADSHEGRVRKGLHFNEEEGKGSKYKRHDWSRDLHIQDPGGKEDMQSELKRLREEIQNLQSQKTLESERANKAESDLRNLKDNFCKLSSEKEDVVFEYKKSVDRISSLETGFSRVQDELKKLNDVLAMEAMKLFSSETRCSQLEKMNQSLQFELNAQGQKLKTLEEEDAQLSTENQNLKSEKLSESERADKAESDVQSLKDSLWKLNSEKEDAILGYKKSFERITSMETEISRVQDELKKLNDVLIIEAMKSSQLEKNNQFLHFELDAQEEKLKTLEEDQSQLKTENLNLQGQIKLDSERADRAESQVQSVKDNLSDLNFEKEAAILQFQQSLERISYLELQLSRAQDDFKKLSDVLILEATKLRSAEDQLLLFEKANRSLQLELDILEQKIRANQEEFSQLSIINENLKSHITTESERADKAETEVQSVQYSLSNLNFEMEAAILQYQHSLERISFLETQISRSQDDFKKLSHEMVTEATKLSSAEERCLQLEKANQSMQLQLDIVEKKIRDHQEENDILKSQIRRESERADTSETEVQSLNDSLHKLSIENEGSILQYQQSLERISYLETQISRAQDDFKKLNDEMTMEAGELSLAQERCLLLEKENESIQLEVDALEKAKKEREEELAKSNTFLQEEHQQHMEAQLALLSMEKSNSKSQEELKLLDLEIQSTVYKLKDVELRTMLLEEEICKLKDENSTLMEQNLSSILKIKDLHDEINMLNEIKGNLVDEMGLYLEEKKVLQHEFDHLKEEKTELEQRHQNITSEMEAVRLNTESFQASLRELQDEHTDLNEICKKHEEEKLLLLEKLENMEKISEKSRVMEKSLADANVELEELREKIKTMEYSFEALHGEVSTHITEKAMLISQVKTIAEDVENLTGKNAFLEEHISVSNLEVEGLMGKLKDLEESFQSLYAQKEKLIDERNTLVSQVNSISQRLENVESWNAELEVKHLNLEREKDLRVHQVVELESFLKLEKQEHEVFIQSSKNQVATLENQILVLREENQVREEEVEVEQQKVMSGLIELFILRSCLRDMKKTILILSKDCQNHLEASRCAEKLVYQLQQEDLIQMEKIETLSEQNEKVKERILLLSRALKMNVECGSEDRAKDEVLLEIILGEIRNLLGSISGANDEIQLLHLEKLVVFTILKQTGLHVGDLKMEKQLLEEELEIRMEELLVLKCDKQELLKRNEQLMEHVQISGHREEEMKADIYKLLAENQSLLRKFDRLTEEKVLLEEQNSVILEEAMALEHLYVLFRSFNAESALMLKLFSDDAYCLRGINTSLVQEIREMNEKLSVLEKESDSCLEEYRNHLLILQFDLNTSKYLYEELTDQIESGNSLLSQKETELSEKNQKVQSMQEMNEALSRNLECLNEEICGAKMVREELENNIFSLTEGTASRDKEIAQIIGKLLTLNSEFEELRSREEQLTSRIQQGTNEVDQCEVEMMTLLKDIQISTVTTAIYEEKIFELILEFESLEIRAMIQQEVLKEEITSRNAYMIELREKLDNLKGENRGLKSHFEAYLPIIMTLQDSIASLEEETISLAGHPAPNKQEKQDNSLVSHHQHDESPLREYPTAMVPAGVLELQKLTGKVGEIQKMITDTAALLDNERLESKMKVIGGVKVKISGPEEAKSKKKHMQMMKDIQLDQVSSSPYGTSVGSYDLTRIETSETDDQMLKLWEAAERDCNGQKQRAPPVALEHDIEAMEEEKSEYPSSELVAEKELSIDRLELSSELVESHQEWSLRIIERLASDAQRLSGLQASMQELESKMESSERSGRPKSLEYDTIKAKLKETEGAVLGLIDINTDLTKKAEEFGSSVAEQSRRKGRRLISERARRGSEKIGRLELELQKIQYILLKLEEEHNNERAKAVDKRAKVVLSDYLYGRRNGTKKKKGHFCGCMRPKTNSD